MSSQYESFKLIYKRLSRWHLHQLTFTHVNYIIPMIEINDRLKKIGRVQMKDLSSNGRLQMPLKDSHNSENKLFS